MRIVDRYITRSIILVFCATIIAFSLLFVLIDSACNLDEFIDRKVSFQIIFQYYLSYLPIVLVQTSSIACLIAILFTFTNLNRHNEVIAMRSSGMSFWHIARPALCFGLLISALVFLINERYIPLAEEMKKKIKNENLMLASDRSRKNKAAIKNLTFYGLKNRLYFIDTFDPNTNDVTGITIIGYDTRQNIKEKIIALNGKWTGIAWKFYQCHITTFDESVTIPEHVKLYPEKLMDIKETPGDFMTQRLNVNAMNIKQLRDYIARFANSGAQRALDNLRVDLHSKIAFPFSNIVIILVGLPFALMTGHRRTQTFSALGIAVAIGFLYYVCNAVGLALGKGGLLSPPLSAWLAPLIFSALSYYLIKTKF